MKTENIPDPFDRFKIVSSIHSRKTNFKIPAALLIKKEAVYTQLALLEVKTCVNKKCEAAGLHFTLLLPKACHSISPY